MADHAGCKPVRRGSREITEESSFRRPSIKTMKITIQLQDFNSNEELLNISLNNYRTIFLQRITRDWAGLSRPYS